MRGLFTDQILQVVATLDKSLAISIFLFFSVFILFIFSEMFSTLIFHSAVTFEEYQVCF